ncbi:centrosomal protein of 78 kDa-like [Elysia marginata]|uniref:Centrosomal protein of 78 kDa-like n=1 Tax=Elysia marginata TaxID=1093978 RepID=A0AAV4GXH9_9GAST|nr:centrosomal protein of 78 kDa-like [Elysia marginata]
MRFNRCSSLNSGDNWLVMTSRVEQHQGMQRHNEAWRDSLRYRRPDLDRMSGLRRITVNANPMLGDEGAAAFAEALKDDLWLKALDLQACGIGVAGARSFLDVLKYNTTLVVLDLRRNPLIERDILHSVMEQLMLNSNGEDAEYKWISTDPTQHRPPVRGQGTTTNKPRRKLTKVLKSSLGKKTTIKGWNGNNSCSYSSWVTPKSTRRSARTSGLMGRRAEVMQSPGLPWRTAARAHRFRGHPPDSARLRADLSSDISTSLLYAGGHADDENDDDDDVDSASELMTVEVDPVAGRRPAGRGSGGGWVTVKESGSSGAAAGGRATEAMIKKLEENHMALDLGNPKEVKIELETMRRHWREERLARTKSDQKIVHLMIENRRLTEEVAALKKAQDHARLVEDESFLESVEASFKQFHAFIDMLREAGMGQLVTIAGLDQTAMPFANGSSDYYASSNGNGKSSNHQRRHGGRENSNNSNNSDGNDAGPNPNTTYANMPLASSAFVSNQQQQHQRAPGGSGDGGGNDGAVDPSVSVSMAASFSEGNPLVIGERMDPAGRGNSYDEESDAARQEADELYSRLLQETRGALGRHEVADGASHNSPTTAIGASVKPVSTVNIAKAVAENTGGLGGIVAHSRDVEPTQKYHFQDGGRQMAMARPITHSSPNKSGTSLSVEEEDEGEELSSPGLSGRGQDDSRAGLQDLVAKDLDSADEDF